MRLFPLFLLLVPCLLPAQSPCGTYSAGRLIQPNRVAAWHSPTGTQFFDGQNSRIQIPHDAPNAPYVICALTPWMFARDEAGDSLTSLQTFGGFAKGQLFAGPLGPGAVPYADACADYNQVWSVTLGDILAHQGDWAEDATINDSLVAVFGWPAQGNPFFEIVNGFPLPADHHGGWAEFADLNGNARYDPHLGEYPCIHINGIPRLPDELHWLVMHDNGQVDDLDRNPLGMELQLSIYGFYCQDEPVLNHTLFHRYKLINQRDSALDSLYFGLWFDPDLGCGFDDDMMGCDTTRSAVFIYNRDSTDGIGAGSYCDHQNTTYGQYPPFQSIAWLSHSMHAFSAPSYNPFAGGVFYEPNLLLGLHLDGTPITPSGNGANPGSLLSPTRYLYPGDPRDTSDWTMYDAPVTHWPQVHGITTIFLGRMDAGDLTVTDIAHTYHQDSSLVHLDNYALMLDRLDRLRNDLSGIVAGCERYPACLDAPECLWPGDLDRNGEVEPRDLLYWGAMKDRTGPARDGRINWQGHVWQPWPDTTGSGINMAHGDADGNGVIDDSDLTLLLQHFLYQRPDVSPYDPYPEGDDVVLSAVVDTSGFRFLYVIANRDLELLGLSFTLEYDTSLYKAPLISISLPLTDSTTSIDKDALKPILGDLYHYCMVRTNRQHHLFPKGSIILRWIRPRLKDNVPAPESTTIRLRDLFAVDRFGNNLHLGSAPLEVFLDPVTSVSDQPPAAVTRLYPNPTSGHLVVDTPIPGSGLLFDVNGQLVRTWSARDLAGPVSLHDLPTGLYFLKLRGTGEVLKVMRQ